MHEKQFELMPDHTTEPVESPCFIDTEMFTATFPEGYEIRFRTPDKEKYLAVQEACRAQIDKDIFNRINQLKDKYRFQKIFVIEKDEQALDFLCDLKKAYFLGLVIDKEDFDWIESTIAMLTTHVHIQ